MSSIFKVTPARKAPVQLISKMRGIVEEIVAHRQFRSDFELNDQEMLDQNPGVYAWYVYDCGTHLMPLSDMKAVQEFQRDWIGNMADLDKKKSDFDRLYVLNVHTGDIRRVIGFKSEKNLVQRLLDIAV